MERGITSNTERSGSMKNNVDPREASFSNRLREENIQGRFVPRHSTFPPSDFLTTDPTTFQVNIAEDAKHVSTKEKYRHSVKSEHVCGSFFSPCCNREAKKFGVSTFSSLTSSFPNRHPSASLQFVHERHSPALPLPTVSVSPSESASGARRKTVSSIGTSRNSRFVIRRSSSSSSSVEAPQYLSSGSAAESVLLPTFQHPDFGRRTFSSATVPATTHPTSVTSMHPAGMGNMTNKRERHSRRQDSDSYTANPGEHYTLPPSPLQLYRNIESLQVEGKRKDELISQLQVDLSEHRRRIKKKDQEIAKLQREIHKIQSVLGQSKAILSGVPSHLSSMLASPVHVTKKQGVSGESNRQNETFSASSMIKLRKSSEERSFIKQALLENDFLKNLDFSHLDTFIDTMYMKNYQTGEYIINEGDIGSHLYVCASGTMNVIKDGSSLGQMGPGRAFGELAILYNCKRTASVRAETTVSVWQLDRRCFQSLMVQAAISRTQANVHFLRYVPLLSGLPDDVINRLNDVLDIENYPGGSYIIRQGTRGDTFYIISKGAVKVTQTSDDGTVKEIRVMREGEYFGEQALLCEDRRTANIIALEPGVTVLALDRQSFTTFIGDLQELRELRYERADLERRDSDLNRGISKEYVNLTLTDLDVVATLGIGGFGCVELVQIGNDHKQTFALKSLPKSFIVETSQEDHVISERNIMMRCNHQFIVRLYRTFKDSKYVYMLLEACLGGEVWSILRDREKFDTDICRFYLACVVEALDYLHSRQIIHRDLKPENLLLDKSGYCKLTDFGFSKQLMGHEKTWTFCGTPEYVSPEIILNKGHDRAVDFWSLGILMYELYTGKPPFTATDPLKTYSLILRGFDILEFPRDIPRSGQMLMKKLCRYHPTDRLGYQKEGIEDIRVNKWFQCFDWEGLRKRKLTPPIVPKVEGPADCSNFDCFTKKVETAPDELSGWDEVF